MVTRCSVRSDREWRKLTVPGPTLGVRPKGELGRLTTPGPTPGGRGRREYKARHDTLPPLKVRGTVSEGVYIPPPPPPLNIEKIDTYIYLYKPNITYKNTSPDPFSETGGETLCLECRECSECSRNMEDKVSVREGCQDCEGAQRNIKNLSILVLLFIVVTLVLVLIIAKQLESQANVDQTD